MFRVENRFAPHTAPTHCHIAPNKRQRAAAAERGGQQSSAPAAAGRENSRRGKGRSGSRSSGSRSGSSHETPLHPQWHRERFVSSRWSLSDVSLPWTRDEPQRTPTQVARSLRSLSTELRFPVLLFRLCFSGPAFSRPNPFPRPLPRLGLAKDRHRSGWRPPMIFPRTIVDRHR